jgi:hypothetical protein
VCVHAHTRACDTKNVLGVEDGRLCRFSMLCVTGQTHRKSASE